MLELSPIFPCCMESSRLRTGPYTAGIGESNRTVVFVR